MDDAIELTVTVARKAESLPRFVVLPAQVLAPWRLEGTTVVTGTLGGVSLGRRSLKRYDAGRWFIDLPADLCGRAEVDTGATVTLAVRRAPTALPNELETVLASDAAARATWSRLTPARQRMLSEHVRAAKRADTRIRRARRIFDRAAR